MPRISHAEGVLMGVLNDLARDWQITQEDWRDHARERFEKDFIDELLPAGRAAVRAMTQLTVLMRRVVRECS